MMVELRVFSANVDETDKIYPGTVTPNLPGTAPSEVICAFTAALKHTAGARARLRRTLGSALTRSASLCKAATSLAGPLRRRI